MGYDRLTHDKGHSGREHSCWEAFVLSRTWPKLGGGQELALGIDKDKLKAPIEMIGRQCYLGILGTDQCVSSSSGRHPRAEEGAGST